MLSAYSHCLKHTLSVAAPPRTCIAPHSKSVPLLITANPTSFTTDIKGQVCHILFMVLFNDYHYCRLHSVDCDCLESFFHHAHIKTDNKSRVSITLYSGDIHETITECSQVTGYV